MTTTITAPKSNIPVGTVTIDGMTYDVPQHPEFVRFFFDLFRRVGDTQALTNTDLQTLIEHLDSEALMPKGDPLAQQAMQAIDELRNEVSSVRSDCDNLRAILGEREAEIAAIRPAADLRARLEQLEDRFT
jgi:hypothetical protein